jgi:hypothetical protein
MNPKFWGPHGWIFLHTVTMNYPKEPTNEDKTLYRNFFSSLKRVLPCEKCAHHYKQHIVDEPIDPALDSRDSLVRWLIKIHNKVNEDLGYPHYTYEQVIEEYKYKIMNMDRDETLIYKVIIGALIMFILYKHFKK